MKPLTHSQRCCPTAEPTINDQTLCPIAEATKPFPNHCPIVETTGAPTAAEPLGTWHSSPAKPPVPPFWCVAVSAARCLPHVALPIACRNALHCELCPDVARRAPSCTAYCQGVLILVWHAASHRSALHAVAPPHPVTSGTSRVAWCVCTVLRVLAQAARFAAQRCACCMPCPALPCAVPCHALVPPYRLPPLREAPVTPEECARVIIAQTGHVASAQSWERRRQREVPESQDRAAGTLESPEDRQRGGWKLPGVFSPSQAAGRCRQGCKPRFYPGQALLGGSGPSAPS